MIAAANPSVFTPYGRDKYEEHPFAENIPLPTEKIPDWYMLHAPYTEQLPNLSSIEDELYIKGKTVIWSRGSLPGSRDVIKTFTMESDVKQALWCTFYTQPDSPGLTNDVRPEQPKGDPMPSICIFEEWLLTVYVSSGAEFCTSLPFKFKRAWASKLGLLIEREANPMDSSNLPLLFALLHPLEDITPIVLKKGSRYQYQPDAFVKLLLTSVEPSICFVFDSMSNTHSVWKIRRAKLDERMICMDETRLEGGTASVLNTPSLLHTFSSQSMLVARKKRTDLYNTSLPAVAHTTIVSTTPKLGGGILHSPLSVSNSPWRSPSVSRLTSRLFTPSPLSKSARGQSRYTDLSERDHHHSLSAWTSYAPSEGGKGANSQHLFPLLCLERLWNESDDKNLLKATNKSFLVSDVVGQDFLCWVDQKQRKLSFVKYKEETDGQWTFDTMQSIPALDAEPLPGLKMVLVLEPSGNLVLYAGTYKIARVHIPLHPDQLPSVSLMEESSAFQRLSLDSTESERLDSLKRPSASRNVRSTPGVQYRRSSLISSRPPSVFEPFEDDSIVLSPVLRHQQTGYSPHIMLNDTSSYQPSESTGIAALKDAVHNRVSLVYGNGVVLRTAIPELSTSSLVIRCLDALKALLPPELALMTCAKYYTSRNAPGPANHNPSGEWNLLANTLMTLIGYAPSVLEFLQTMNGQTASPDVSWTPEVFDAKRSRPSDEFGHEEDWSFLLGSNYHYTSGRKLRDVLGFPLPFSQERNPKLQTVAVNVNAPLFTHLPAIVYVLHLIYEDSKLDTLSWPDLVHLVKLLAVLSWDLNWKQYVDLYWRDFPWIISVLQNERNLTDQNVKSLQQPAFVTSQPPCVHQHLWDIVNHASLALVYPCVPGINDTSCDIITVYAVLLGVVNNGKFALNRYLAGVALPHCPALRISNLPADSTSLEYRHKTAILHMAEKKFTPSRLDRIPPGVGLALWNAIYQIQYRPPSDWPTSAYFLLGRNDLIHAPTQNLVTLPKSITFVEEMKPKASAKEEDDGLSDLDMEVLKLVFPKDQRIQDVRKFLCSSRPVPITLVQRPEVSDHEFIEEQERHLYAICVRTMALPVGRGMVSLFCGSMMIAEPLSIPRLCLTGRVPPRDTAVDLSHIDVPPHMALWPAFHHGVAAGLKIPPGHPNIDSSWICFNRPKGTADCQPEHAGFLLALGLTGHLAKLEPLAVNDYLGKGHDLTSLAILLGLAVANKGTKDSMITRALAIHVEALLPPTCTELDIPSHVEAAALMGLGWLYLGSADRRVAEVLLAGIGRPPGPEMENCTDREAYSLAAGLALGLVTLGRGEAMVGLLDLQLADTLYYYMVGGGKRPWHGPQREKYKTPSYQIKEGDRVNTDVTSAGATLALGLMFHRTGNKAVAQWMDAPHTQYLLDFVRPDFLLLRTLAKGLILWDDIKPSKSWVESHIPAAIKPYCLRRPSPEDAQDVDFETMNQAYCNILCGACLALGLKFAGSCNQTAFNTLFHYTKAFATISGRSVAELAGRSTIETCLNVMLLSLAMVMSGSGDLQVLRLCRYLRSRVGPSHSVVTYGSHIATHMALGMLFLGGGKCSLSTDPISIAALVCACYPKFPTHSNDNRYHLQAFRHLYVIATQPRLLIPRDLSTGKPCYAHIRVVFDNVEHCGGSMEFRRRAPCILPELKYLKEVTLDDERYWTVSFQRHKNWNALNAILESAIQAPDKRMAYVLGLKQKVGYLSYQDDPQGFKSMYAQGLSTSAHTPWLVQPSAISALSSLSSVQLACQHLLESSKVDRKSEAKILQFLATVLYECVKQEKLELFLPWIAFLQSEINTEGRCSTASVWQLKFLLASSRLNQPKIADEGFPTASTPLVRFSAMATPCSDAEACGDSGNKNSALVTPEMALALEEKLELTLSQWKTEIEESFRKYMEGDWRTMSEESCFKLACFLLLRKVPSDVPLLKGVNPLAYKQELRNKGLDPKAASQISICLASLV